jgi:hypothetical protein
MAWADQFDRHDPAFVYPFLCGMFVTTAYRTLVYEEKKKTNCSFEKIEIPPLKSQNKTMNYSKLGPDGFVKKGLPVY